MLLATCHLQVGGADDVDDVDTDEEDEEEVRVAVVDVTTTPPGGTMLALYSAVELPPFTCETVTIFVHGPAGTCVFSTHVQPMPWVMPSSSVKPKQPVSAGETSVPAPP
jgi:hypothetical protein